MKLMMELGLILSLTVNRLKKSSLINHINYYCCETFNENYGKAFIQAGNVEDYIMSHINAINEIVGNLKVK